MLCLRKPTDVVIEKFLATQAELEFTYSAVGATATTPPAGYVVDHTRVKLGQGEAVFAAAQGALRHWEHFRLGWTQARPKGTALQPGNVIAVQARVAGLWTLNACRIIAVIDEDGSVRRSGFTYGTLPDHAESGEERFLVEWDRADDSVWYDILAFSRPRHILARLGYPLVRRLQKRFARDSAAAMVRTATSSGLTRAAP